MPLALSSLRTTLRGFLAQFPARGLLLAVLVVILPVSLSAQEVNPGTESGLPPFGSFTGSNFDQVNLDNGNLHMAIPLVNAKERGQALTWSYVYDSPEWTKVWYLQPTPQNPYAGVYGVIAPNVFGWQLRGPLDWQVRSVRQDQTCASNGRTYSAQTEYVIIDPVGTKHQLPLRQEYTSWGGTCMGQTLVGPALDSSGMVYNATTNIVTLRDGTQITPGLTIQDSNGNQATQPATDSAGRNLITVTQGPTVQYTSPLGKTGNGPQYTLYEIMDSTGTQQTYRADYELIDYKSDMCSGFLLVSQDSTTQASGGLQTCIEATGQALVPRQLTLPNGKTYVFTYNNNTPLQLATIALPTGGTITYTYYDSYAAQPASNPHIPATIIGRQGVGTRAVNSNGTNYPYTYTRGGTVTYPNGDVEVHTFGKLTIGNQTSPEDVEFSITYKDSTGTILKTVTKDYTGDLDWVNGGIKNIRQIRETTKLDNGLMKKVETDYETFQYTWYAGTGTANRLNPTEVREFDFGSGSPGPLLRRTDYTYLHNGANGSTYQNLNIVDRVASTVVYDGNGNIVSQKTAEYDNYTNGLSASGAVQHNSNYGTSYLTRGNVTAVSQWRNTDGAWLTNRHQFDDAGNILSATDPRGNTTQYDYTDSWTNSACAPASGQAKAYITKTTNALGQTGKRSYYSCTGLVGSRADANNQTTSFTYDSMNRPLGTSYPDQGQTTYTYDDTNLILTTGKLMQQGKSEYSLNKFDQLGQQIEQDLCEDGSPACSSPIATKFSYDGKGRLISKTNPCRPTPDSTCGTTQYQYDAIDRQTLLIPPDGSASSDNIKTQYCGNTALVTDQSGKWRRNTVDGLGRLIEADEPNAPSASVGACPAQGDPVVVTAYSYNALDLLTGVVQNGSRQRTFVYDSLSRIISSTNPESNTAPSNGALVPTTYAYDASGNLTSKTAPAPNQQGTATVTLSYCYDALNRQTSKAYTAQSCPMTSPVATYVYDSQPGWGVQLTNVVGRLTEQYTGTLATTPAASVFGYDPMGRVILNDQCTPINCGTSAYQTNLQYDLAGNLTSQAGPAWYTLTQSFDSVGRPTGLSSSWVDSQHPATLATVDSAVGFFPSGALRKITLGNGLTETAAFNNRLQPCRINVNSSASYLSQCTDPVPGGNVEDFAYGFNAGTADNGDVASMTGVGTQSFNRSYTYDQLNRLLTMSAPGDACSGLSWTYDAWGNRTAQTPTGGTCTAWSQAANAQNRITGYSYDTAGNLLNDGSHSYSYDAENRLIAVDGGATASYAYDAGGKRASKTTGSVTTNYLYDTSGKVIADLQGTNWVTLYTYFDGKLLAEYTGGTTYFVHKDHLGSTRLLTAMNQSIFDSMDYLPYGEQIAGATGTTHKFTSKERDLESNLNFFGARYYTSQIGRFMNPDPSGIVPGRLGTPQGLNLYEYTANNPLRYIDPNGKAFLDPSVFQELKDFDDIVERRVNELIDAINAQKQTPTRRMANAMDQLHSDNSMVARAGRDALTEMEEEVVSSEIVGNVQAWINDPKTSEDDLRAARDRVNEMLTEERAPGKFVGKVVGKLFPGWMGNATEILYSTARLRVLEALLDMLDAAIKQKEKEGHPKKKIVHCLDGMTDVYESFGNGPVTTWPAIQPN